MNKVFKNVWNASLGEWVAVSENGKGQKKGSNKLKKGLVVGAILSAVSINGFAAETLNDGVVDSSSVVLGLNAIAENAESVAIGHNAKAAEQGGVAIGSEAETKDIDGVAIGFAAQTDLRGVAIGADTYATANATAIGNSAKATSEYGTAIGFNAKAEGENSIAVGAEALVTIKDSIALGHKAVADKVYSSSEVSKVDINGEQQTFSFAGSSASGVLSIGNNANKLQIQNVAAGRVSSTSTDAINGSQLFAAWEELDNQIGAVGAEVNNLTQQVNNLSVGGTDTDTVTPIINGNGNSGNAVIAISGSADFKATAGDWADIALGVNASAIGGEVIAIGHNSVANDQSAITIGSSGAESKGQGSTAIGKKTKAIGSNTIAIGTFAEAYDPENTMSTSEGYANYAIAVGTGTKTQSMYAIGIGTYGKIKGQRSIGLGDSVITNGNDSIAIGTSSEALNQDAIAIGTNTETLGATSTAIGYNATVYEGALDSLAIGTGATVGTGAEESIAIGKSALVNGKNSTVIGQNSSTSQDNGVVLGNQSYLGKTHDALKVMAAEYEYVDSDGTIKKGTDVVDSFKGLSKTGEFAQVVGENGQLQNVLDANGLPVYDPSKPTTQGLGAVSIGSASNLRQLHYLAAGRITADSTDGVNGSQLYYVLGQAKQGQINADQALAAASQKINVVSGDVTTQVGLGDTVKIEGAELKLDADGNSVLTFKPSDFTDNDTVTAVINGQELGPDGNVAISGDPNKKAQVLGDDSVAIGSNANTTGAEMVAIGNNASATGQGGVALGANTITNGQASVAIGKGANALEIGAIAMGNNAYATRDYSIAIGGLATATQSGNVAIGDQASATIANSVAIGQGSTTKAANENVGKVNINGKDIYLDYAGSAKGVVSVGGNGSRQIQKVAAGLVSQSSTDAINGSQLYSVLGEALKGQLDASKPITIVTKDPNGNDVTTDIKLGDTFNIAGAQMIIGEDGKPTLSIDAVDSTWMLTVNGEKVQDVKNGNTVDFSGDENISVSTTDDGLAITLNPNIDLGKDGSLAVGDVVINKDGVDLAGGTINNVADATEKHQAVNLGQMENKFSTLEQNLQQNIDNTGWNLVTGNSASKLAGTANSLKITGDDNITVSQKELLDDNGEVIGSTLEMQLSDNIQLSEKGQLSIGSVVLNGQGLTAGSNTLTDKGLSIGAGQNVDFGGNRLQNVGQAQVGTDAVNLDQLQSLVGDAVAGSGWTLTANGEKVQDVKNGNTVDFSGDKNISVSTTDDGLAITLNPNVDLGEDGSLTVGNVVIDKDGIDLAGGTIDNVADATEKHQAVNLGQLEDKLGALGDQLGSDIQNAGWNIVGVDADGAETTSKITNDQTVAFESGKNTTVSTELTSSGAKVTVDIKDDITLDGEKGGLTVSAGKGKQDITIQQGNVSFGNNQLNNVAAGTVATDAVNVGQLSDALSALGGGAGIDDKGVVQMPEYTIHGQDYTNVGSALDALQQADVNLGDRITNLQQSFNNRIDDVEDRMSAGIAAAMALENAPYIPGKYTYSAATAYHNGQAALGVTLRKTSDNGLWSVTGGVAAGTEGDPSVRLGISGVIK